jgi:uncharacterized protein DUF3618
MSTPEQIQRDIEGTRQSLSADVDRLSEKVSPGRVVGRRVDRVKGSASSVKERVMGSVPDPDSLRSAGSTAGSGMSSAKDAVGNAVSSVGDAAGSAPQTVRRQTQGNPLAAGLVAFGVGMVLSSLVPASQREQDFAAQAEDKARGPVQAKAKEFAGQLQESAQESVAQVKEVASKGASDTAEQARSAADDVKAPLQQ